MMGNMMDMLGLDGYIEQIKPHATKLGAKCERYAEQIKARLEAIHEAVDDNTMDAQRLYLNLNLPIQSNPPDPQIRIPNHEVWTLEYLTFTARDNAQALQNVTLLIRDTNGDAGRLLLVKRTSADTIAPGLVLQGNLDLAIYARDTTATIIEATAVFRKEPKNKPVRKAWAAGQITQPKDMPQLDESTTRHVGLPTGGQPWQG